MRAVISNRPTAPATAAAGGSGHSQVKTAAAAEGPDSRSGGQGPGLGRSELVSRLPKFRGFRTRSGPSMRVALGSLEVEEGQTVTLNASGTRRSRTSTGRSGVGNGTLSRKLTVALHAFTATARAAIEEAGGRSGDLVAATFADALKIDDVRKRIGWVFWAWPCRADHCINMPGVRMWNALLAWGALPVPGDVHRRRGNLLGRGMGITPYINASIIITALTVVIPQLRTRRRATSAGARSGNTPGR